MKIFLPVYKKMRFSPDLIIRRELPVKGDLVVKKGQQVVPFTKLGRAKVPQGKYALDQKIKLEKNIAVDEPVFEGEVIGKVRFKKISAPYTGYLTQENGTYYFNKEKAPQWVLSGLWGEVVDLVPGLSVDIKTTTVDMNFIAFSRNQIMGELIVFPNPSQLLDLEYMRNFSGHTKGKIIYIGHHIRKEIVEQAIKSEVGAVIGGSMEREIFNYAVKSGLTVCITTGFGAHETPGYVFDFLKNISNRHVFVNGELGLLQIPMPPDSTFSQGLYNSTVVEAVAGTNVIVFEQNNFGKTGKITRVQNKTVYVKLNGLQDEVAVIPPNILALD